VINYGNGYENAFVTGSDGNLYYRFFDGSNWHDWVPLGHPNNVRVQQGVPAVINYGAGNENAYVTGSDGNLCCARVYPAPFLIALMSLPTTIGGVNR
jgi:hypothetical protein